MRESRKNGESIIKNQDFAVNFFGKSECYCTYASSRQVGINFDKIINKMAACFNTTYSYIALSIL